MAGHTGRAFKRASLGSHGPGPAHFGLEPTLDTRGTGWCEMPTTTQVTASQLDMNGARCEALFSSKLEPTDVPTAEMVTTAISRTVQQFGIRDCAGRMAQEFGDHPDMAARRMGWVRQLIAQDGCRQAPETGHERDL